MSTPARKQDTATTVMMHKSPSTKKRDATRMTQFNLRKKEDEFKKKIKYLEQRLERKENLIYKLEGEISKLKLRFLKFDNSNYTIEEVTIYSFCTSTPKSGFDRCEECLDKSECTDCIVKHVLRKHESLRKILF